MTDPTMLRTTDANVTISLMPVLFFSKGLVEIMKEVNASWRGANADQSLGAKETLPFMCVGLVIAKFSRWAFCGIWYP